MYYRDDMLKYVANNFETIFNALGKKEQGAILGCAFEVRVAQDKKADCTDVAGSDIVKNGKTSELKYCGEDKTGHARWGNIDSKKDKCDDFIFGDGIKGKTYEVPHDVVFNQLTIHRWNSGSQIKLTKKNKAILEQYEVTEWS